VDTRYTNAAQGQYVLHITAAEAEEIKSWSNVKNVVELIQNESEVTGAAFPHHENFTWNFDNFGPITIPSKGWTVQLDRSEEHTSELQSRENLVCLLLLEK